MKKQIKELLRLFERYNLKESYKNKEMQSDRRLSLEQLDAVAAGGKSQSCKKIVQGKKAGMGNIQLRVFNDENFNEEGFNGNPVRPIVDFEKIRQNKLITSKWIASPKC